MGTYGQFCPIAKALEVVGERWALLVVREVLTGSTRYGEIARSVPGCPPATLSKRLKELTTAGVLRRTREDDGIRYEATEAGWELYGVLEGLGHWGQRWARSTYGPDELDPDYLMWDIRSYLQPTGLGAERAIVELAVRVPDRGTRRYWIVVEPGSVDLCLTDPDQTIDVVLDADLRAFTMVWMGDTAFADAEAAGDITVTGKRSVARRLGPWIGQHPILATTPAATPAAT